MIGFRPLIGVSFCKHIIREITVKLRDMVSVPLSGLASVNINENTLIIILTTEFPSPYRG